MCVQSVAFRSGHCDRCNLKSLKFRWCNSKGNSLNINGPTKEKDARVKDLRVLGLYNNN